MNAYLPTLPQQPLTGWGRYPVRSCTLQRPEKIADLTASLSLPIPSLLLRGWGRSYGDAALNPSGQTILTERLNRMIAFDEQTGILRCEAGVTFEDLLRVFVPRGWFPSVTPGTKFVTMGGAIAFDVHGKNHHVDGSFARHVRSFNLVLASGETITCSRTENSDCFWATVGGMGLTGMITEVEITLRRIPTAYIQGHHIKAKNIEEAIALFERYESDYQYSVAWIDCLASGAALGRSILMLGNHAQVADLSPNQRSQPLAVQPPRRFQVFFDPPNTLLNHTTVSLFNSLYFNRQRSREVHKMIDYDTFFYPLDFLWDWNRLYGKRGFVQYQCVIPQAVSREALTEMLTLYSQKGWGSFLAVLKRLGEQASGWLSFPMAGYTLALDMPIQPGLWEFLAQLDDLVVRYGGRVYLAKDACLSAAAFRAMYPDFPQWLAVKSAIDPDNRFTSALAERLEIRPHPRTP